MKLFASSRDSMRKFILPKGKKQEEEEEEEEKTEKIKVKMVCLYSKLNICIICVIALSSFGAATVDEWWEHGHFYQIYTRSFQDSDGDGIGDLNGIITDRLEYLKLIGVTGVWLTPIFASPMADFGYDISNFRDIHHEYGSMEDFNNLVAKCKELDLRLILDFVPNHCSDQHEWFLKSSNKTHPEFRKYKNYFVWHEGKRLANGTRLPPSNWLNIFRGSAWTWHPGRGAFYLHQFLPQQPDLNFRNQQVVDEMKMILRFWLDKGVDGFRIDAVPVIFEADINEYGYYDDELPSGLTDDKDDHLYLNNTETFELDETYDMIYQWRKVFDEYTDSKRLMMTESYTTLSNTMRYYGQIENGKIVRYGGQIPFNFQIILHTNANSKASDYKKVIESWLRAMPKGDKIHANWVIGNHDRKRIASRCGPAKTDLLNILLKTLPGITVTYNGEEIGMTDVYIPWRKTKDPQALRTNERVFHTASRDPARTPFQWDNSKNAGFSTADQTWLPVANNYTRNNVKLQMSQSVSHLKVFCQLMRLRQNPTMKYGSLNMTAVDDHLLIYKRETSVPATDVIVVLLNFGGAQKIVNLMSYYRHLPKTMKVATISIHAKAYVFRDNVNTSKVTLGPNVGLVLIGRK